MSLNGIVQLLECYGILLIDFVLRIPPLIYFIKNQTNYGTNYQIPILRHASPAVL